MYEHNALGYRSGLALCLTKVRSSRARCPATALVFDANQGFRILHKVACTVSENIFLNAKSLKFQI